MERKREQRVTLVHELAVMDRTTDYLKNKWTGKEEDFRPTLEKMADLNDSKKWTMKKSCWKELDVWKYDYDSQDDRQTAIDNAVRQYDKQRLSSSEVEWQRLLPKEERGKGKCLSRLQANLAKGPAQAAPKIKVDGSGPKDDTDGAENDKPKNGGESMSRSNSTSSRTKSNKPSAQEAQTKRLLGNSKSAAAAPKPSPTKAKPARKTEKRELSAAIIENSDSSGDEPPIMKPKPVPAKANKAKDTVIVNTRPSAPAREPVKKPPVKRPREESDSSSSSGTPLSKRIKPKQPLPAPGSRPLATKSSQQSQARAASTSFRSKNTNNTSPTKSSPLASSPPTNASDLDEEPPMPKKRKADKEDKPMSVKRRAVPSDVLNKAHKFKTYYQQYETLHYEITALDNPPHEKLASLLDLRDRLQNMKREIYKQYSPDRE